MRFSSLRLALISAVILLSRSSYGRILTAPTVLAWSLLTTALAQTAPAETGAGLVVLPKSVPDPFEPANRFIYSLNKGILTGVVKPTAKVYRLIVFKPVRRGIGNFG